MKEVKLGTGFTFLNKSVGTPNWKGTKIRNWVHHLEEGPRNCQVTGQELKQGTGFTLLNKSQGTTKELGLNWNKEGTGKELKQGRNWVHLLDEGPRNSQGRNCQGTGKELEHATVQGTDKDPCWASPKELPGNWEGARTINWVCLVEQVPRNYQGTGKELKQETGFTSSRISQGTPKNIQVTSTRNWDHLVEQD